MKVCSKCKEEKPLTEFSTRKRGNEIKPLGQCKKCVAKISAEYHIKNAEKIAEYNKKWREENKENQLKYREKNKDKIAFWNKNRKVDKEKKKISDKNSYEKHKEKRSISGKKYREKNKDIVHKKKKEYTEKNKEKLKIKKKIYYQNNKNDLKEKRNKYRAIRRKTDPIYKSQCNLRKRTWEAFKQKSYTKGGTTEQLLGAPYNIIKKHIERQFKKGMTWENYGNKDGDWHIDHIIPLSSAKTEEELISLCHYTNLQPLFVFDNLSKRDKIIATQMTMTI